MIDLSFADFILLSILQILMYTATTLEVLLSPSPEGRVQRLVRSDLRTAATWAFWGTVATVSVGLIAQANVAAGFPVPNGEVLLLVVPAASIVRCAIYQRASSKMIDMEALQAGLRDLAEQRAVQIVERDGPLPREQLARQLSGELQGGQSLGMLRSIAGRHILGVPVEKFLEIFGPVYMHPDRAGEFVDELVAADALKFEDGRVSLPAPRARVGGIIKSGDQSTESA